MCETVLCPYCGAERSVEFDDCACCKELDRALGAAKRDLENFLLEDD